MNMTYVIYVYDSMFDSSQLLANYFGAEKWKINAVSLEVWLKYIAEIMKLPQPLNLNNL